MSDGVRDTIRKRRTIREYLDEEVTEEHIDTLLEMAMAAPNRLNQQPWHFFVIRDKDLQRKLDGLISLHPQRVLPHRVVDSIIFVSQGTRRIPFTELV